MDRHGLHVQLGGGFEKNSDCRTRDRQLGEGFGEQNQGWGRYQILSYSSLRKWGFHSVKVATGC